MDMVVIRLGFWASEGVGDCELGVGVGVGDSRCCASGLGLFWTIL